MRRNATTAISGLLLGLLAFQHLVAQAPRPAPPNNAMPDSGGTANPSSMTAFDNAPPPAAIPSGQAPEEMTRKITELVHAGNYSIAEKLTVGLLVAYPDDQRLVRAKALIDKLLSPAGPTSEVPAGNQFAADPNAEQLTGMDKVDYNALIVLARQAQGTTDLDEQRKVLRQFMDQGNAFLEHHPDQMLLWQLRAASAISLNDPAAGYEAGQKLLTAGAADSNDPALQQLLGQLRNKGWLDKQGMQDAQELNWLRSLNLRLVYGTWSTGHINVLMKTTMTLTISGFGDMKEPVNIRLENASPKTCRVDGGAMGTITIKPEDLAGGIYTTSRKATLTDWHSYEVPCTVNVSLVDKTGRDISRVTINNGY